jgi:hypothetical protein
MNSQINQGHMQSSLRRFGFAVGLGLSCLVLSACSAANSAADAFARDAAKSIVEEYVEDRFPGVRVAPVTDCIIDNASASEILTIARASALGTRDAATLNLVADIAGRPNTVQCIAENGLSLLG